MSKISFGKLKVEEVGALKEPSPWLLGIMWNEGLGSCKNFIQVLIMRVGRGEEVGERGAREYPTPSLMMMPVICSWNIRGIGRGEKRWGVRDFLKRGKGDIITLQETKLQSIDRKISADLWGRGDFDFVHKPAVGRAGGLLVAWNKSKTEVLE